MNLRRTTLAALAASTALALGVGLTVVGPTAAAKPRHDAKTRTLEKYARDTWRSMDAMTDKSSGLPADNITGSLDTGTRSRFTSPTNIGAYLWSTVVARDTGLISGRDAHRRMARTLGTLGSSTGTTPAGCSTTGTTRTAAPSCGSGPRTAAS